MFFFFWQKYLRSIHNIKAYNLIKSYELRLEIYNKFGYIYEHYIICESFCVIVYDNWMTSETWWHDLA